MRTRRYLTSDVGLRALLSVAAILPFWRLLSFDVIWVTDDRFTSDIFNGELAGRALEASLLRGGEWPVWTNKLCGGLALAGLPADPLGLLSFAAFPTATALDVLVLVSILIAAHGTYSLARRIGIDRAGAFLAAIAYADCGVIAAQLRHLSIVSTIVWLPVGLLLLDRAFAIDLSERRKGGTLSFALYGLVLANQVLCGFPQTAYICCLAYGAFAAYQLTLSWRRTRRPPVVSAASFVAASVLAVAAGAVVLLPTSILGNVSDRGRSLGYEWATQLSFWPAHALMFLRPYYFGDASNNTYAGVIPFWEEYPYVGLATVLFALYGTVHRRAHRTITFFKWAGLAAFLCALGRYTPVYRIVYELVPGFDQFRFPNRFLFIVEFAVALLGGHGLSRFVEDLRAGMKRPSLIPSVVTVIVCAVTVADLFVHQPRQNAFVSAAHWLSPPKTVDLIKADSTAPRTFTPGQFDLHRHAFEEARGWVNVEPYDRLRLLLQPNIGGGYWNLPSAECYAGLTPRWYVDLWGDINRGNELGATAGAIDFGREKVTLPSWMPTLLRTYGVTHVLTPFPLAIPGLTPILEGEPFVYRVERSRRARMVSTATVLESDADATTNLKSSAFDPDREVFLSADTVNRGTFPSFDRTIEPPDAGRASIISENSREVIVETDSPAAGLLVLADTFYPGWHALVDRNHAEVYRANLSTRAVAVPAGRHTVRFSFELPGLREGFALSVAGLTGLLAWITGAWRRRVAA